MTRRYKGRAEDWHGSRMRMLLLADAVLVSVTPASAKPTGRTRDRDTVFYSIFHSPDGVRHSLKVNFRGFAQSGYDTDDWTVRQSMPL
jgi:hypothetical protein